MVVDELLAKRRVAIHLAGDPPQHQPLLQLVVLCLDADASGFLLEQYPLVGDVANQLLVEQRVVLVLDLVHFEQQPFGRVQLHVVDENGTGIGVKQILFFLVQQSLHLFVGLVELLVQMLELVVLLAVSIDVHLLQHVLVALLRNHADDHLVVRVLRPLLSIIPVVVVVSAVERALSQFVVLCDLCVFVNSNDDFG